MQLFTTLLVKRKISRLVLTPDGAVDKVRVSVPDGHVVQSMNIDIDAAELATSTANSFQIVRILRSQPHLKEGVDVNSSSSSLLPKLWDFESGNFGPEWTLSGSSNWTTQSSKIISGSQTAQAGAIFDNEETSITLDVSSITAGIGSFKCEVSSEEDYDYFYFCIDNTGCNVSLTDKPNDGQVCLRNSHFNITSSTKTLTWKYIKDGLWSRGQDTAWIDDVVIDLQSSVKVRGHHQHLVLSCRDKANHEIMV